MSERVHSMFSTIAPTYDRANTALSFGVHHAWRRRAVAESGARAGDNVLDCATGTGDLAIAFKRVVGPSGSVLGTDFNADMLSFAPAKAHAKGLEIGFEVADAMALPYRDASFDIASIAFGIRNVDDPATALSELARVVRPGGRVVVLEFGQPRGVFGSVYDWYSRHIIPRIGGMITGDRTAYEYLPETAAAFPCREDFLALMRSTGRFSHVRYVTLTGGIAFIYVGVVA
jgi:demethylmenaquinone methyltransferase/2-methoxy-6-polyprenyl-1,4-benzoquinol methylase